MYHLVAHPDTAPSSVSSVTVQLAWGVSGDIWVEFMIAPIEEVALPEASSAKRASNLWQSTCFEVFLKYAGQERYFEFNLSPSQEWAAYAFDSYRSGMHDHPVKFDPEIEIMVDGGRSHFWLATDLPLPEPQNPAFRLGLSTVIEEKDGRKSYWALAHPEGPPDFHHDTCFAASLPAMSRE